MPLGLYAQWYQVNTPTTKNLNHLQFVDNLVGYCGGENSTLLKSTDGGDSWSVLSTSFGTENIYEVYFKDAQNGMIRTESNIYRTIDAGLTFQALPILTYLKDSLPDYKIIKLNLNCKGNISILYTAMVSSLNAASIISTSYKSYDFGETWVEIPPLPSNEGLVKIIDSLTWFCNHFTMYRTIDGGQNWTASDSAIAGFPPESNYSWQVFDSNGSCLLGMTYHFDLLFLPNFNSTFQYLGKKRANLKIIYVDSTLLLSYFANNQTIVEYFEDISSVIPKNSAFIQEVINSICLDNSKHAWMCGQNGKIYKNLDITLSNHIHNKPNLVIYPNPTKGKIMMEYPHSILIRQIRLTNLNGQVLREYDSDFDELDVTNIPSGNYLLQLSTDQGNVAKKITIK